VHFPHKLPLAPIPFALIPDRRSLIPALAFTHPHPPGKLEDSGLFAIFLA
jgi:hypothetical protein